MNCIHSDIAYPQWRWYRPSYRWHLWLTTSPWLTDVLRHQQTIKIIYNNCQWRRPPIKTALQFLAMPMRRGRQLYPIWHTIASVRGTRWHCRLNTLTTSTLHEPCGTKSMPSIGPVGVAIVAASLTAHNRTVSHGATQRARSRRRRNLRPRSSGNQCQYWEMTFECALHNPIYWSQKQVRDNGTKWRYHTLCPVTSPNTVRFPNFFTFWLTGKFMVKSSLKSQPQLKHVATLPCEILMHVRRLVITWSEYCDQRQTQGSVATRLSVVGFLAIKLLQLLSVHWKIQQFDQHC